MAFSCQILGAHGGKHIWTGFEVKETTSKPAVPREQEAAQTLFALFEKRRIGERKARVAFLNKHALCLLFAPLGKIHIPECSYQDLGCVVCEMGPRC